MPFCRPASRALSHLLRHEPVHYSSPASLFARHSPLAPFSRAFNDPFFASPFSAPLYTVYEVREDDNNAGNSNNAERTEQQSNKQDEVKAAEQHKEQQRSNDNRLTRHSEHHNKRWLDRHSHRRHRHQHHSHHPLSLFSPFDSLFSSPLFASSHRPLEMSVDLYSTPTAYQVNAAIPGVRKEDIKVTIEDGVLTIEAERREERGRPAKATPTPTASAPAAPSTATATATPTEAHAAVPQSEPKTVEVEVKADNVDSKPVAATETAAADTQPQQQSAEQQEDEDDVSVHHQESYYGRVQRSLSLPDDVNVDGLTAKYEDGVLRIELPRVEEKRQQVKQINIQ